MATKCPHSDVDANGDTSARGACAADAAMPTGPMNSSPSDINKMVMANTTNGVEFSPPPTNGNSTNIPNLPP